MLKRRPKDLFRLMKMLPLNRLLQIRRRIQTQTAPREKTNDSTIEEMPDKSDEQDTDADSSLDSSATDTTADQSSDAENDIDSSTDNSTTDTGDTEPTKDDPGH